MAPAARLGFHARSPQAAQTLALVLVAISAAVALEIEVVVDGETKMAQVDKAALLNLWNDVVKVRTPHRRLSPALSAAD